MKRLSLLPWLMMLLVSGVSSGSEMRTFKLTYINSMELIRTLDETFESGDPRPTFSATGKREITMQGGDAASQQRVADLVKHIDLPCIHVPTKFVRPHHVEPRQVAGLLNAIFAGFPEQTIAFQSVANHRTREVFMMGTVAQIQLAETMIRLLDSGLLPPRIPVPPWS